MKYRGGICHGDTLYLIRQAMRRGDAVLWNGVEEDVSNYVLHGELEIFGTPFTFADEVAKPVVSGNNLHLTINPHELKEATEMFNELKESGEVFLPPTETFYSPFHASVMDKYGIVWNIIVV